MQEEEGQFWWPFGLSETVREAYLNFKDRFSTVSEALDSTLFDTFINNLDYTLLQSVDEIIERDGLPFLCHLVNGWGDFTYKGEKISKSVAAFVHKDKNGKPFIYQCEPEGDFHPWQTFAYLAMAGVDFNTMLTDEYSIKDVALNSTDINNDKGTELGHLLYALSAIPDAEAAKLKFKLKGETHTLPELVGKAIEAHITGDFKVCRKIHLTEGLCVAIRRHDEFLEHTPAADFFLRGQIEILYIIGALLHELENDGDPELIRQLRESLVITSDFENHAYYAGHIIELATLVYLEGYRMPDEVWRLMVYVTNRLNRIGLNSLENVRIADSFLHFGHYRRGITLLQFLLNSRGKNDGALSKFTADFSAPLALKDITEYRLSAFQKHFTVVNEVKLPTEHFQKVLDLYSGSTPGTHELRGRFEHFRRILIPGWPRAVHYEFLDYGKFVGCEIHIENEGYNYLQEDLKNLKTKLDKVIDQKLGVIWDGDWYKGSGRLVVLNDINAPEATAANMKVLINETMKELGSSLQGRS